MPAKNYSYLEKVCIYLTKMAMHDYDLLNYTHQLELTCAIIFVAFKIIEQLDKDFPLDAKVDFFRYFFNIIHE